MFPEIPWIKLPTFNVMIMLASLFATFYAYFRAKKKGLLQVAVLDIGIIGTIAGIVGAKMFGVLFEPNLVFENGRWQNYYALHPWHVFRPDKGGLVSYGALILIGVSTVVYLKIKKLDILKYLDLMALSFPIVVFFVRLGCLGAGCCYGKKTDFFFHLVYKIRHTPAADKHYGEWLHATQVYDMLNAVFLFVLLHLVDRKKKFDGQIVWIFLIGYALIRGVIEFFRGDADRGVYTLLGQPISTAQIVGISAVILGTTLYFYSRWRSTRLKQQAV